MVEPIQIVEFTYTVCVTAWTATVWGYFDKDFGIELGSNLYILNDSWRSVIPPLNTIGFLLDKSMNNSEATQSKPNSDAFFLSKGRELDCSLQLVTEDNLVYVHLLQLYSLSAL